MNWVWDTTNRFRMRPQWSAEELDEQCEAIVSDYLRKRHGQVSFPVGADDLRGLLEREAESVDLAADLTGEKGTVDGLTEFRRGRKPAVRIVSRLTSAQVLENRLRTVLAHTYGHVHFHDFLFQSEQGSWLSLFEDVPESHARTHRCHRDSILPLREDDWMEWQAGFVCGALLMPFGALIELVRRFRHARDLDHAALSERSLDGVALIRDVAETFQTSWEAARVRLVQESILAAGDTRSLF